MEQIGNKPRLQANAVRYDGDCMSQSSAKRKPERNSRPVKNGWKSCHRAPPQKNSLGLGKFSRGKERERERKFGGIRLLLFFPFHSKISLSFFSLPFHRKTRKRKIREGRFFMDLFLFLSFSIPPLLFYLRLLNLSKAEAVVAWDRGTRSRRNNGNNPIYWPRYWCGKWRRETVEKSVALSLSRPPALFMGTA